MPGAIATLLSHDWNQLTAAASASPRHVSSLQRWTDIAKKQNPALTDEQAERVAQLMKTEHYRKMARLSAAARARARAAASRA